MRYRSWVKMQLKCFANDVERKKYTPTSRYVLRVGARENAFVMRVEK